LRPARAKINPISTNKLGVVAHTYNSGYTGGISESFAVSAGPTQSMRHYLKSTTKAKKGWGHGLSDRAHT
jgi:hypothetical protein